MIANHTYMNYSLKLPQFPKKSLFTAGAVAILIIASLAVWRESSVAILENSNQGVGSERQKSDDDAQREQRTGYSDPKKVFFVQHAESYSAQETPSGVLFYKQGELDTAESGPVYGVAVRAAGDKKTFFSELYAASDDESLPGPNANSGATVKKLQNISLRDGLRAVEFIYESTVDSMVTQVVLIDGGAAGFFEVVNTAPTAEQHFVQAPEFSRVLSSFLLR
jgi:hypothetical protein